MKRTGEESEIETTVDELVPSRTAYFVAWCALFVSGVAGGFIGYAMITVFAPGSSQTTLNIGTVIIAGAIVYAMSVVTNLGLQASVEWKARALVTKSSQRPSRLLK